MKRKVTNEGVYKMCFHIREVPGLGDVGGPDGGGALKSAKTSSYHGPN